VRPEIRCHTQPVVSTRSIAPPDGFYDADPARLAGPPGSVVDALELDAPDGLRCWAVLCRSIGTEGGTMGLSGLVVAPAVAAADWVRRPIVAWAHGTTGLADGCAPSRLGIAGLGYEPLLDLARQGFIVAATDYEGLGTPGLHPYLVGASAGRSVLDSIRAAAELLDGTGSAVAVVGISQGGHAALWAGELAATYAPELDVRGIIAASPPIDLRAVQAAVFAAPSTEGVSWIEALMVAAAWHDAYGAPLEGFLTAEGRSVVEALATTCPWDIPGPQADPFLVDPGSRADWQALMEENSPGRTAIRAPVLVLAAHEDEQVPASTIPTGVERLRGTGSSVELRWVDGGHVETLADPISALGAFEWLSVRLAAGPLRSGSV
jgi:alpha-beta hydrolase superfamily lysophospholipase